VYRHARRLVDREKLIVLEEQRKFARRRARGRRPLGHAQRRHAHLVAPGQPGRGLRAALVDAHFARADDAIHVRLGHPLEQLQQIVVEPLPVRSFIDHQTACGRRIAPYNELRHVFVVSV
jgi:hypothetical protein